MQRFTAAQSKVSAHYVVFEDGRIIQCVLEEWRAWHAGELSGAGETDINSSSIGIEIVNPGHEFGYPDFPLRQTAAVISLCQVDHHPARGRSAPTASSPIPTSRPPASRIPARNFRGGSTEWNPVSVTGCAPRLSTLKDPVSGRATAATR